MMHEREKSDPAVVAVKLANKAERSAAESVEPRAGTEGNAGQHSTCRAQYRVSVSPALERIRHVRRQTPEVGEAMGRRRRSWHLHRPCEPMEVAPWPKSMISAEA